MNRAKLYLNSTLIGNTLVKTKGSKLELHKLRVTDQRKLDTFRKAINEGILFDIVYDGVSKRGVITNLVVPGFEEITKGISRYHLFEAVKENGDVYE